MQARLKRQAAIAAKQNAERLHHELWEAHDAAGEAKLTIERLQRGEAAAEGASSSSSIIIGLARINM